VNQGPRGECLMKKTEGRKSRDTVPLKGLGVIFLSTRKPLGFNCIIG
jgi:hypothetical protein